MKREDKVISLELAKQIDIEHKRLGIEVESEWWWANYCIDYKYEDLVCSYIRSFEGYKIIKAEVLIPEDLGYPEDNERTPEECITYSAYDTVELIQELKKVVDDKWFYIKEISAEIIGESYLHLLKEGHIK